MSISTTTNRVAYNGDGSSAVFSFPYPFFAPADIEVFLYNSSAGSVTAQVLNTNYSIGGTPNAQGVYTSGGTVIFTCAAPSASIITINRNPSVVQNYALLQNGQINSIALVQQLDYLTLLAQRLHDRSNRSLRLPDGFGGTFSGLLPSTLAASANLLLGINSSALGVQFFGNLGSSILPLPLGISLGGTGQTSAAAAFNALSPVTSAALLNSFSPAQISILTSNSTYIPPAGAVRLEVTLTGGGGGGGGCASAAGQSGAGAGGGGGGTVLKMITAPLAAAYPYIIGNGGLGGSAGNFPGGFGSSSVFGSSALINVLVGIGGNGGSGGISSGSSTFTFSPASPGGDAVNGDVNISGGFSGPGMTLSVAQASNGWGGFSYSSPGTVAYAGAGVSTVGSSPIPGIGVGGGGGSGGLEINNSGAKTGGGGQKGVLIVKAYFN